jgi:hypothetical protein
MELELNDGDYILAKGEDGVWITVDSLSVRLLRTDEGLVIRVFPLGEEANTELGSMCVDWQGDIAVASEAFKAAVAATNVAKDAYAKAAADAAQAAADADAAAEAEESAAAAYFIAEDAYTDAFAALEAARKAQGVRGNL